MADDAQDALLRPERTGFLSRFAPTPRTLLTDNEVRGRMRTLDQQERKWGFGAVAVPLLAALIYIPSLLHNTHVTLAVKLVNKKCPPPGHLVHNACVVIMTYTPSHYVFQFTFLLVLGLVLLLAVWRSMRVLVAVASLLSGFLLAPLGFLLIFYGGWLLLRSWRAQRYGVTGGAAVRQVVSERAAVKREAKRSPDKADLSGSKDVTQSKRYTPKAKPRKR